MRRILLLLTAAILVAVMMAVTAGPAMAKNTFQDPLLDPFQVPEENPPGPPTVSGGAPIHSPLVFHCEGGGAEVVKFTKEGEIAGTKGGGDCAPV